MGDWELMNMNSLAFFVQNNMVEHLTRNVATYARENNIPLEDRSSNALLDVDNCGIDWSVYHPVIIYGSVQFLRKANASSLAKYVQYSELAFSSELWEHTFQNELLNSDGCVLKAKDVHIKDALHVRPLSEDKAFTAKVFNASDWEALLLDEQRPLSPEILCWASGVKNILAEWRCWFIGGKLVSSSQYRQNNSMHIVGGAPASVTTYAQEIADHWLPAECVVMDIAEVVDGLRIIEFNPIHCSGWYAGDVNKILGSWVEWYGKSS